MWFSHRPRTHDISRIAFVRHNDFTPFFNQVKPVGMVTNRLRKITQIAG